MKLFKKPKSKFYRYDVTVRGRRYRASSQETKQMGIIGMKGMARGRCCIDVGHTVRGGY